MFRFWAFSHHIPIVFLHDNISLKLNQYPILILTWDKANIDIHPKLLASVRLNLIFFPKDIHPGRVVWRAFNGNEIESLLLKNRYVT